MNIKYKQNLLNIIKYSLVVFLFLGTVLLSACTPNDIDENNTIVELTMNNYTQYINIQQEIISSTNNPYTKIIQDTGFSFTRASQTTKISAVIMKNHLEFNNVIVKLTATTLRNSFGSPADWNASSGNLILGYDGSGFVMLTANFDSWTETYMAPVTYKVSSISGSITILK